MKILKVKDLSELLKVRPSTIYYWAETGLIPSFKLNGALRFDEEEIMDWIRTCKKQRKLYTPNYTGRRPRKGG